MPRSLLFAAIALLALVLPVRADATTGPLLIVPQSPDWTVKYEKSDKGETYTLVPPANSTQPADFVISRWASAGNADQIPSYLGTLAKGFLESAQRNPKIQLASYTYTPGEFIGFPYSGKYVEFSFRNGAKDYLFIFGDDSGLWYGHFIGTTQGWLNAVEVLKNIKKSE